MIAPLITSDTAAIWSDSERCLIGSMLVWPEGGHLDTAHTAGVAAASFHTPANHRIFAAIEAISARGEIADTAAVCAELGPRLELVGGYAELGALEAAAPPHLAPCSAPRRRRARCRVRAADKYLRANRP